MRNLSFAFVLVLFGACAGNNHKTVPGTDELAGETAADDGKADGPQNVHDVDGYLAVYKTGPCNNPIFCAPYQLTRPNRSRITCLNDDQDHDSCSVRAISYSGLSQDQQNAVEAALDAQTADPSVGTQVLIKGQYKIFVDFLAFEASEVWMAQLPYGSTDEGTWVLLSDSGIRCFGNCKEVREEKLNSSRADLINGIDYTGIDQAAEDSISTQELTAQGVIVVGDRTEGVGEPNDTTTELRSINQAFFPVVGAGGHPQGSFCTDFTRCDAGLVCTGSNGGPGTCQPQ